MQFDVSSDKEAAQGGWLMLFNDHTNQLWGWWWILI